MGYTSCPRWTLFAADDTWKWSFVLMGEASIRQKPLMSQAPRCDCGRGGEPKSLRGGAASGEMQKRVTGTHRHPPSINSIQGIRRHSQGSPASWRRAAGVRDEPGRELGSWDGRGPDEAQHLPGRSLGRTPAGRRWSKGAWKQLWGSTNMWVIQVFRPSPTWYRS